ncbi:hypothetical protein M514_27347 [Trichuris suis]|uniref:Uncharacterized protein n=1 Tax=Trichuris suis TaxID=68888 RepID=A0A085MTC1_9BILA|nr:hypothetical protein M514_27347 [Trichuris suis]
MDCSEISDEMTIGLSEPPSSEAEEGEGQEAGNCWATSIADQVDGWESPTADTIIIHYFFSGSLQEAEDFTKLVQCPARPFRRFFVLHNHLLVGINGFASSCVPSLSCFLRICPYKSNVFSLNVCPLMGIPFLFISSTQQFNGFSIFTNILSRDMEVSFGVCCAALKLLRILSLFFTISRIEDSFFPYILATAAYDLPSFSTKSRILTYSLTESTSWLLLGLSSVPALMVFRFGAIITTTSRESFMFFNDSVIARNGP